MISSESSHSCFLVTFNSYYRDLAEKVCNLKKVKNNARKSLNRQLERAEKARNITEREAIKIHRMEPQTDPAFPISTWQDTL